MEETRSYDSFPIWIVILCGLATISVYAVGAYVLAGFGILVPALYLLYCLWIEVRILRGSCVNCYYYGKLCGLGRGKLCSSLFKRGNPQRFAEKQASWSDVLPDFLVFVFPIAGGIVLLVRDFTWLLVAALAILVVLYLGGNAVTRGSLACKYCKQREIGCPAEKLFGGEAAPNK
jgi:hypothetical protein